MSHVANAAVERDLLHDAHHPPISSGRGRTIVVVDQHSGADRVHPLSHWRASDSTWLHRPSLSFSAIVRPPTIGIRAVAKYPGATIQYARGTRSRSTNTAFNREGHPRQSPLNRQHGRRPFR